MEPKEFLQRVENTVLTEMVKDVNQLLSQDKTNFLSLGLFLNLPVEFTVQQTDVVPFAKKMTLPELSNVFTSTVYAGSENTIRFIFMYNNEKHLKHILKVAVKYTQFFAYHYLKQIQHILRNHYTTAHQSFMLRNGSDHSLTPYVNEQAVNTSLKQMFDGNPEIKKHWKPISEVIKFRTDEASELEILKEHRSSKRKLEVLPVNEYVDKIYDGEITFYSHKTENLVLEENDEGNTNLATRIYDTIRSAAKGTGGPGCQIMMDQFESVETDTQWFKKLKTSFEKTVYHKTENFSSSWKQLNNRYRHIFNAPTITYKQSKINLLLSVDQSGSMSTLDLQKLLYLIEQNSKRIQKCTVIVHTGTVDKVFDLESDYDISESPNWKFLEARLANGGTSHAPVFNHIQNMNLENPTEYIYISLSDNYSDIEESIHEYPVMTEMSKYWLSPIGSKHVNQDEVGGINITMT